MCRASLPHADRKVCADRDASVFLCGFVQIDGMEEGRRRAIRKYIETGSFPFIINTRRGSEAGTGISAGPSYETIVLKDVVAEKDHGCDDAGKCGAVYRGQHRQPLPRQEAHLSDTMTSGGRSNQNVRTVNPSDRVYGVLYCISGERGMSKRKAVHENAGENIIWWISGCRNDHAGNTGQPIQGIFWKM